MKISLLPQKLHRQRYAIDTVHTQTIYNTYVHPKEKSPRGKNVLEYKTS